MKSNQHGITLITLLLALVIVCLLMAVSLKVYNRSFKAATGNNSKATTVVGQSNEVKNAAVGAVCRESLSAIQKMVDTYQMSNNQPPSSLDEVVESAPELKTMLNDTSSWVSGGGPKIESSSDSYTLTGYCIDGNTYVYSPANCITVTPTK